MGTLLEIKYFRVGLVDLWASLQDDLGTQLSFWRFTKGVSVVLYYQAIYVSQIRIFQSRGLRIGSCLQVSLLVFKKLSRSWVCRSLPNILFSVKCLHLTLSCVWPLWFESLGDSSSLDNKAQTISHRGSGPEEEDNEA